MSCCGQKRNEYKQESANNQTATPHNAPLPQLWRDVRFEYTGQKTLTVTGPVTGKLYLFTQPGDKQLVDYRDAMSMRHVPVLKAI